VNPKTQLKKALNTVPNLTAFQLTAAKILLAVNGIENALEYIELLKAKKERP